MLRLHAHCVISRLRCNGHSLLSSSFLTRIGRIENSSCSACGHSSQDTLISFCLVQLRNPWATRSVATLCLWSRPWRVTYFLGLHGLLPCPHPFGRGQATTTTSNYERDSESQTFSSKNTYIQVNTLYQE